MCKLKVLNWNSTGDHYDGNDCMCFICRCWDSEMSQGDTLVHEKEIDVKYVRSVSLLRIDFYRVT